MKQNDPLPVAIPSEKKLKHRFHAMVKPVGSQCNLDCTYCYYLHKEELFDQSPTPRMSDELLEAHIRQYIEAQDGDEVIFSWQGGEPTILGVAYFRRVVELQSRYKKSGQRIENDLQTNGTLLDDEWASFLKENHFLVGLSCDGPKKLHNAHRRSKGGEPTHDKVVAAASLLRKYKVPFSVLCVVNRENAKFPYDVYRFITRDLRAKQVQFISCVEPKVFRKVAPQKWSLDQIAIIGTPSAKPGVESSVVTDWSVDPDDWGYFLCKVWDDWFRRDYGKVHVDLFENVVAQSMGLPAQRCITAEFCGKGLAIEHTGDVFSCDHYVYPEYRIGNIADTHWVDLAYSEQQEKFGFAKQKTLPQYCRSCTHLNLCWGECPKNRLIRAPDGEVGLNYLCSGLKEFYSHIEKDMQEILRRVGMVNARQ
jgi:serine-type anaerobic sulfatase-maturating enzyme